MQRACDCCGKDYEAKTKRSRFCSDVCRVRGHRAGGKVVLFERKPSEDRPSGGIEAAARSELEEAGRQDSMLGRTALALAARIDASADTAAGVASLAKELRATMDAALATAQRESPVDELRRKRLERLVGG